MDPDRSSSSRKFGSHFPDAPVPGFRSAAWQAAPLGIQPFLFPTLVHALAAVARDEEERGIVLVDEEGSESKLLYSELWSAVLSVARRFADTGVSPGDAVLLVLPTSFEFIASFFALELIGAIPVPFYPPASADPIDVTLSRLTHIARSSRAVACVTSSSLAAALAPLTERAPSLREVRIAPVIDLRSSEPELDVDRYLATRRGGDTAFVQYTSGSTGHPKGVQLAHANVMANVHAIGQRVQLTRNDGVGSWLPMYHDMGLIGCLLMSVYWQLPLVLMSPRTFLSQPARWLSAMSRHRLTLSPAPNFAYALCVRAAQLRPKSFEGIDLSRWRVALNGAEPVNARTVRDFVRTFAPMGFPATAMCPVYGLAESSLAVTFPPVGEPLRVESIKRAHLANGHAVPFSGEGAMELCSVGTPMPGHEVLVVDENLEELPPREVGHILVRGASVMEGYYEDPEATAEAVREGWLWTGDLGYKVDEDLFVTGRMKDLIILRGRNYYAEDVEAVVEGVGGVRLGGAVVFALYDETRASDVVIAVCETALSAPTEMAALERRLRETIASRCDMAVEDVVFIRPGGTPRTSSGKKQRSLVRERYVRGELVRRNHR